jgi:hypothetical protein
VGEPILQTPDSRRYIRNCSYIPFEIDTVRFLQGSTNSNVVHRNNLIKRLLRHPNTIDNFHNRI